MRSSGQYNTNSNIFFLCFDLYFIIFLINTREKQELSGVETGTSGLLDFGCTTECIYIYSSHTYNKYNTILITYSHINRLGLLNSVCAIM